MSQELDEKAPLGKVSSKGKKKKNKRKLKLD